MCMCALSGGPAATDHGIPNRRFQDITFHFTKKRFYERKNGHFRQNHAIRERRVENTSSSGQILVQPDQRLVFEVH